MLNIRLNEMRNIGFYGISYKWKRLKQSKWSAIQMENFDYFYYARVHCARSLYRLQFCHLFVFRYFYFLFSLLFKSTLSYTFWVSFHFRHRFIIYSTWTISTFLYYLSAILFTHSFVCFQSFSRYVCVCWSICLSFSQNQNIPCSDMQYILYYRNTDKNNKINK